MEGEKMNPIEKADDIGKDIEQAVATWSPLVALAIRGVRLLIDRRRADGDDDQELKSFAEEIGRAQGFVDEITARGAEYRRRRAAEEAAKAGPTPGGPVPPPAPPGTVAG